MRFWIDAGYSQGVNQQTRNQEYRVFDPLNEGHCPVAVDGETVMSIERYPRLGRKWAGGAEYLYWISPGDLTEEDPDWSIMFRTESRDVNCEDDEYSLYDYEQQPTNLYFCREPGWVIVRDRRDSNWSEEPMPWGWAISNPMTAAEMMYEVRNFPLRVHFMPIEAVRLFPTYCLEYHWRTEDPIEQLPYQELVALGFR